MKLKVTVEISACPDGKHCDLECDYLGFAGYHEEPYCHLFGVFPELSEFGALRCAQCKAEATP